MGLKSNNIVRFLVTLCSFVISLAIAAQWQGPTTVISLTYGSGPEQVEASDSYDAPGDNLDDISVDMSGNIAIPDNLNNRILIFGPTGIIKKDIEKPSMEKYFWPGHILMASSRERLLVFPSLNGLGCVYDFEGNIHKCFTDPRQYGAFWKEYAIHDGFILNQSSKYGSDDYWSVDLEGNLVGKLPERPLELGRFVIENGKKYLKFPGVEIPADAFWNGYGCHLLPDGNLYCEDYDSLYNSDGVKIGTFEMPPEVLPETEGRDFESYTEPFLDPEGNIYAIKYSLDHYNILKWIYVGPEAATKSKSSTAPESKPTAKPAPPASPPTKAATGEIKQPDEPKVEATAKPSAKEGKKATPEVVQKEQQKDEGK